MNARGATVPFSAGFSDICMYNERRAEKSVRGGEGTGGVGGCDMPFGPGVPTVGPRSCLRRTTAAGADTPGGLTWGASD